MKSGILREDEGYEVLVNGIPRSFRDIKEVAYAAALLVKRKAKGDIVEVRDRSTGLKSVALDDGGVG